MLPLTEQNGLAPGGDDLLRKSGPE